MTRLRAVVTVLALLLAVSSCRAAEPTQPGAATAQAPAQPAPRRPGRQASIEASALVVVSGPSGLGARSATLTLNQTGAVTPLTYFETRVFSETSVGVDVRVGLAVTRSLSLEGMLAYRRPSLLVTVEQDFENAPDVSATAERLSTYEIGGAARLHVRLLAFRQGRGRPYVTGGLSYLRELHEGRLAVDTGMTIRAGGGLTYLVRARAPGTGGHSGLQGLALRAEAVVVVATGGYSVTGQHRTMGQVGGGLLWAF